MSNRNKKRLSAGWVVCFIVLALVDLTLLIRRLLQGNNVALLDSKGLIAHEEFRLMLFSAGLLLAVAVPTIFLLYFFAWKYRESNTKVHYDPHMRHGKWFVFNMWAIPSVFMLVLALVMVPGTHNLAPQKSIAAGVEPLRIQVISLRWKWVFIYPEQRIATVNFMQVPINTPLEFDLTADEAPMSSFWVPNLGGQLYTMTGHSNRLNLVADTLGDYPGSSAEINGAGFAGMKFTARVSYADDFERWVQGVRQSQEVLDTKTYEDLLVPSKSDPATFYAAFEPGLYDTVLAKYYGPAGGDWYSNEGAGHH